EPNTDWDDSGPYRRLYLHVTRLDKEGFSATKGDVDSHAGIPLPTSRRLALYQHIAGVADGRAQTCPVIANRTAGVDRLGETDAANGTAAAAQKIGLGVARERNIDNCIEIHAEEVTPAVVDLGLVDRLAFAQQLGRRLVVAVREVHAHRDRP